MVFSYGFCCGVPLQLPGPLCLPPAIGSIVMTYAVWDATGWQRDYSPPAWRNQPTEEQKRIGWEMAVWIEKIL